MGDALLQMEFGDRLISLWQNRPEILFLNDPFLCYMACLNLGIT